VKVLEGRPILLLDLVTLLYYLNNLLDFVTLLYHLNNDFFFARSLTFFLPFGASCCESTVGMIDQSLHAQTIRRHADTMFLMQHLVFAVVVVFEYM
jgi:hypothetical protein